MRTFKIILCKTDSKHNYGPIFDIFCTNCKSEIGEVDAETNIGTHSIECPFCGEDVLDKENIYCIEHNDNHYHVHKDCLDKYILKGLDLEE